MRGCTGGSTTPGGSEGRPLWAACDEQGHQGRSHTLLVSELQCSTLLGTASLVKMSLVKIRGTQARLLLGDHQITVTHRSRDPRHDNWAPCTGNGGSPQEYASLVLFVCGETSRAMGRGAGGRRGWPRAWPIAQGLGRSDPCPRPSAYQLFSNRQPMIVLVVHERKRSYDVTMCLCVSKRARCCLICNNETKSPWAPSTSFVLIIAGKNPGGFLRAARAPGSPPPFVVRPRPRRREEPLEPACFGTRRKNETDESYT